MYNDSAIYKSKGKYSVRWDGEHQTHLPNPGHAATGWGPDINGRICRMAAFKSVWEALKWLDTKVGDTLVQR